MPYETRTQDTDTSSAMEYSMRGFEGSMLGEFYGPNGEEVGGVFNGERAATDQVINGRFGGETEASAAARAAVQTSAGREDGISASQDPAVYADSSSDSLSDLLPDGNTAFAPLSAAVRRDWNNYESTQPDEGSAFVKSISSDGANGFNVTYVINGRESAFHFTEDVWLGGYFELNTNYNGTTPHGYALWSQTDSFGDPSDRTSGSSEFDYFDMSGWVVSVGDDSFEGYSTYGARTRPENLPTGSATYDGRIFARLWEGESPDHQVSLNMDGHLVLNAVFDSSEITGQVDGLSTKSWGAFSDPYEPMAAGNTIDILNGMIAGGQFEADWAGNDTNVNSALEDSIRDFAGTMMGEFYGPNGEEVGGVLGGHRAAVSGTPGVYLHGAFGAKMQDETQ